MAAPPTSTRAVACLRRGFCPLLLLAWTAASAPTYLAVNQTVEVIWERPAAAETLGVVFIMHGSATSARRYWPKSDACPVCAGFVGTVCMVEALVRAQLAVLMVSAPKRTWLGGRAWTPRGGWEWPRDRHLMEWGMDYAKRELGGGGKLPFFAISLSSGSVPVFELARHRRRKLNLTAHVAITPADIPRRVTESTTDKRGASAQPPTLLVYNARDTKRAARVHAATRALRGAGVPAAELELGQYHIGPGFFASQLPSVSAATSSDMYLALKRDGLLDADDNLVNFNPMPDDKEVARGERWRHTLRPFSGAIPEGRAEYAHVEFHNSDLEGMLNLAYGFHAFTCEQGMADIVDFFLRARLGAWRSSWREASTASTEQ